MNIRFIPEARKFWKLFSAQALMFIGGLQTMVVAFPTGLLQAPMPFTTVTYQGLINGLTVAAAILGFLGRFIDQSPLPPDTIAP